ncbi:MAG: ATP-binding protein [Phototrophicaceae bacterium]
MTKTNIQPYQSVSDLTDSHDTTDRLLVAISPSPLSVRLLRAGYRMAQQLDAELLAVYIEHSMEDQADESVQSQLNETMQLAKSLGATTFTVTGDSISDMLIKVAREHQVTKLIVGQTLRSRWEELIRGSIVNNLIRASGDIDVYVISTSRDDLIASVMIKSSKAFAWRQYAKGIVIVALATLFGMLIDFLFALNPTNLVMIYLLAIVIASFRYGYGVAALASFLSVVVFNVAFVPPRYTFRVEDAEYIVTFIGLGSVGLVTAYLAAQVRHLAVSAQNREQQTARLYAFSQDLAIATDMDDICKTLVSHTLQTIQSDIAIFLPHNQAITLSQSTLGYQLNETEHAAARESYQKGLQSGKDTKSYPEAIGFYRPIRVAKQLLGVIGIQTNINLSIDQERLLDAFISQFALALEALQFAEKAQEAELLSAKETLQTTILNSVSHDLRTPLVSVKGALSSLLSDHDTLTHEMQRELLLGAYEEADRLNRLVGNLLEMSRLQSGTLYLKREPYAVQEVISVARTQLQSRLKERDVQVNIQEGLPLITVDLVLFAQVMVNLLDNAAKYSPEDMPILIDAFADDLGVHLTVADSGVGIPENEISKIFGKFYRASTSKRAGGSGLGLSIVQGIVDLHHATITVHNRLEGGTIFSLTIPLSATLTI